MTQETSLREIRELLLRNIKHSISLDHARDEADKLEKQFPHVEIVLRTNSEGEISGTVFRKDSGLFFKSNPTPNSSGKTSYMLLPKGSHIYHRKKKQNLVTRYDAIVWLIWQLNERTHQVSIEKERVGDMWQSSPEPTPQINVSSSALMDLTEAKHLSQLEIYIKKNQPFKK